MGALLTLVLSVLVTFSHAVDIDKLMVVKPNFVISKLWNNSMPYHDPRLANQMIFEFEIVNKTLPFSVHLRVSNVESCDRIRICLPSDEIGEYNKSRRFDICLGRNILDFDYENDTLIIPEVDRSKPSESEKLKRMPDDDTVTFGKDHDFAIRFGKRGQIENVTSSIMSNAFVYKRKHSKMNFTLLQDSAKCAAKLRQESQNTALKMVSVYSVDPPKPKQTRQGVNMWAAVIGFTAGSLIGIFLALGCLLKCRYTWYSGYYESMYSAYAYNADPEAAVFEDINVGNMSISSEEKIESNEKASLDLSKSSKASTKSTKSSTKSKSSMKGVETSVSVGSSAE
ncbi:hypothetical protein L596_025771 [Steinernema carpocapsae]|uniref:Uncharacterized protein n=1 Tax=Steinernema carpocapsae TaxID=34508 RepID=A0A4U5M8Q7_STECR|nr:hypothetical protein L596_025771 [Steinernema carpocapsae]